VTFEADILADCELFDAVQTVTLTLLDGTTESVAYVTTSKLTKEQTRQYGPIGADDEIRNFSLPVNELSSNVPEQDCTITDASGIVWKIKSAEKRTVGTRYLCMCVKTRAEYETVLIPTGLAATVISETQINLTWTDNSGNETTFDVQRSTNNATWTTIASTAANATSCSATGLTTGTLYYFRIRARNAWTQSDWTSSVNKRTWLTSTWNYGGGGNLTGIFFINAAWDAEGTRVTFGNNDTNLVDRSAQLAAVTVGSRILVASVNGTKDLTVLTQLIGAETVSFTYTLNANPPNPNNLEIVPITFKYA
jgi:hypothetical protein